MTHKTTGSPKAAKKTVTKPVPAKAVGDKQPAGPATAPELPSAVARQYGLHHYRKPAHEQDDPAPANDSMAEDAETQAAVDDIVAKESDTVLEAEDAQFAPPAQPKKRGFWRSLARPFVFWWQHKWLRWTTIILLLAAIVTTFAVPASRYAVLNGVGVRSSASVTVLDQSTQLPLRNVQVQLGGVQAQTNKDGVATLRNVRLGPATLAIKRIAFAPVTRHVTVGWGSNPLGSFSMTPTGTQYTITVTDYLSGKPLEGAEASSGNGIHALADKQGKITLTVSDTDVTQLDAQVQLGNYRTETLTLQADHTADAGVVLVPARKSVFVSRQSGKYDVYSMYLDGRDRNVVLPGTGHEGQNISLVVNSAGDRAALVSTRDNVRDSDRYLLSTLTVINLADGTSTTVEHGAQIQLVDWVGNRLVYRIGKPGASAADSQRYRLVAYDHQSKSRQQLANANQFSAVLSAEGTIYYAVPDADAGGQPGFFKVKPDGSGKVRLFQQEVWSVLRTAYGTMALQTPDRWFSYSLGALQPVPSSQPSSYENLAFVEDAAGERSVSVDERDGKGTLLLRDKKTGTETAVHAQDGLVYPVRWLDDNTILFRVATAGEIAEYAKSLRGGEAKKITDLTNTFGYLR